MDKKTSESLLLSTFDLLHLNRDRVVSVLNTTHLKLMQVLGALSKLQNFNTIARPKSTQAGEAACKDWLRKKILKLFLL